MDVMKKEYTEPDLHVINVSLEVYFCLSDVNGTGGTISGYDEDDEDIFNG